MKISYGKQSIEKDDINEVVQTLKSDFLTCGPKVKEFEEKFAKYVGAKYAVAVSNGTAALHLSCLAAGLKQGEELITSPMTFVSSANCAFYCGANPVFVDIKENGLIDENKISEKINSKTKIIVPVHYGGLPCEMHKIKEIAEKNNLVVIEDACHALGARYKDSKIGDCKYSDMTVFSFHPVKHITTGEGGIITTNSKELYKKLLILRTHGITKEPSDFLNKNRCAWYYEMQELGFNYRITDIQCALGISQLSKVENFIEKRRHIAQLYNNNFKEDENIELIPEGEECFNSFHLYVIKVKDKYLQRKLFNYLRENGIFCQVHYIPVYFHPYYAKKGYIKGICPVAESFYERAISLPIYPALNDDKVLLIVDKIKQFFKNDLTKKVVAMVQVRMASTRLPGKVFADIEGKPNLWHHIYRLSHAKHVDQVVVSTADSKDCDVIAEYCKKENIPYYRGDEVDVLDRLYQTALKFKGDILLRITGDCPLIDPELIDNGIELFKKGKYDFVSNNQVPSYPHGLDFEIFSFEALERAWKNFKDPKLRALATFGIYHNNKENKIGNLKNDSDLSHIRITLDYEEDLVLIREIFKRLSHIKPIFHMKDIVKLFEEYPYLNNINAMHKNHHRLKDCEKFLAKEKGR